MKIRVHIIAWITNKGLTVEAFGSEREAQGALQGAIMGYAGFAKDPENYFKSYEELLATWDRWAYQETNTQDSYSYGVQEIEVPAMDALVGACRYTLDNLEAGYKAKEITAPKHFHAQLGESMKMLEKALELIATVSEKTPEEAHV